MGLSYLADIKQSNKPDPPLTALFGSTFPWDFEPKWPLTHGERLAELESISAHYSTTLQKDNLNAVKAYHARFPSGQMVSDELVLFQNGEKLDPGAKMKDIDSQKGSLWDEGPPVDDFMV